MREFSLYVHIPFCLKKCPYCDFNSYQSELPLAQEQRYTDALLTELNHWAKCEDWASRPIISVFFGGGTPSLFTPESIKALLEGAHSLFGLTPCCEITLEANPASLGEALGKDKLAGFLAAGVNRLSIGAQSFSHSKLNFLGRLHGPEAVSRTVHWAKEVGYQDFNVDLIFGTKNESLEVWQDDLVHAIALEPTHLSCYCLTIEAGTEFGRLATRGTQLQVSDDLQYEMYCCTQEQLKAAGYWQYEISNYAKPGHICVHNMSYWSGIDYLGLGAGAHSAFFARGSPGRRWSNIPGPLHYINRVQENQTAIQRQEQVDSDKALLEFFFLGLRTARGLSMAEFRERFAQDFTAAYRNVVRELSQASLIGLDGDCLYLTPKGFAVADSIIERFCST